MERKVIYNLRNSADHLRNSARTFSLGNAEGTLINAEFIHDR